MKILIRKFIQKKIAGMAVSTNEIERAVKQRVNVHFTLLNQVW